MELTMRQYYRCEEIFYNIVIFFLDDRDDHPLVVIDAETGGFLIQFPDESRVELCCRFWKSCGSETEILQGLIYDGEKKPYPVELSLGGLTRYDPQIHGALH